MSVSMFMTGTAINGSTYANYPDYNVPGVWCSSTTSHLYNHLRQVFLWRPFRDFICLPVYLT